MATAIYTDAGQAHTTSRLLANTGSTTYYVAWGSGSTAPAVTQTALITENPESRAGMDATFPTQVTTQSTNDTARFQGTITATGNRVVNEAGIFTASSAGTMLMRGTHATLNIETGDKVQYTFDLQFTDVSGV